MVTKFCFLTEVLCDEAPCPLQTFYDSYPWYYYYLIIGNANAVINRIDKAEGSQEEKDFLKAEALTFRAYSFFRLKVKYVRHHP